MLKTAYPSNNAVIKTPNFREWHLGIAKQCHSVSGERLSIPSNDAHIRSAILRESRFNYNCCYGCRDIERMNSSIQNIRFSRGDSSS
jgi:hypothetical protein